MSLSLSLKKDFQERQREVYSKVNILRKNLKWQRI